MIDCAGTNYFVTVVMFMNHLLEIGISQTKVYIQITYIMNANLWIRINSDSHRFQLDYDEVKSG